MKRPARWHFLSLLPLPILAGWFVASQPSGAAFVDQLPMAVVRQTVRPVWQSVAAPTSQYPPPQVGESSPPEGLPPTF